jgi:hypothetical protein
MGLLDLFKRDDVTSNARATGTQTGIANGGPSGEVPEPAEPPQPPGPPDPPQGEDTDQSPLETDKPPMVSP